MSVLRDMLASWRAPETVMARRLSGGPREDRALATLMGASLVSFVAQWPQLSRDAFLDPSRPLDARFGAALLATIFIWPLFAYLLALASQFAMRLFGAPVSGFGARMALFWALLAIAPLLLLNGLVAGFVGPGPAKTLIGALTFAGFLYLWMRNLRGARRVAQGGQ